MTRDLVKLAKTLGPGRVAEIAKLRAENERLNAERALLLAVLKAAREHQRWCLYSLEMPTGPDGRKGPTLDFEEWEKKSKARWDACKLGPPLSDCEGIETP